MAKKRLPAKRHQKKKRKASESQFPLPPGAGMGLGLLALGLLGKAIGAYAPAAGEYVGAVRDELEKQSAPVDCTGEPGCLCIECKGRQGYYSAEAKEAEPPRTIKLVKGDDGVYREEQ